MEDVYRHPAARPLEILEPRPDRARRGQEPGEDSPADGGEALAFVHDHVHGEGPIDTVPTLALAATCAGIAVVGMILLGLVDP